MKKYLKIILIGAASWSKNDKIYGGQWSDFRALISAGVDILAVDPEHKKESDKYIQEKTGVPVYRASSANVLKLNSINIYDLVSEEFFRDLVADFETYFIVLTFNSIEKENPSFEVAKRLKVKNNFFHNINNALFLAMGCLCKPPNILDLLLQLGINPYGNFDSQEVSNKLMRLNRLQEMYYAMHCNIDALSRAYQSNMMPEWGYRCLKRLRHIGIKTLEDAHQRYQEIDDYKNIGISKLINDEMKKLDIIKYWEERPNDFL